MKNFILLILGVLASSFYNEALGQVEKWNTPGDGNPVIPGYFADPTIKKFGDTYYIYATTDGNGGGLGPSVAWISKDLANWSMVPMNWPTTYHIWAPDVMHDEDGKFYMYYCEPCKIYCGVSDTPIGPWHNLFSNDTTVLVPDRFVKNVITLDGQSFVDDDGSVYLYWGTWGIYKGFGCGVGKLSNDRKSFTQTHLIPNTEATDFFEAPFMIKRKGIYYFMYSSGSCHDETYRVQYATSKIGPMGPFTFGKNNPILSTNADSSVHGPGHHSILKNGDDYYIVYHRHNIPQSTRGMHRQIAIDKLVFNDDGSIRKVVSTHCGVGNIDTLVNASPNLSFCKKLKTSSYYNENFKPQYAVDDNNATLWRPKTSGREWIEIDLGGPKDIRRILTQFEYPTLYYKYFIEVSMNEKVWNLFADRRNNHLSGSPMIDRGNVKARYIRLIYVGGERKGQYGAIWNIKVFDNEDKTHLPSKFSIINEKETEIDFSATFSEEKPKVLMKICADDYCVGDTLTEICESTGKGIFHALTTPLTVVEKKGFKAFAFDSIQWFRSDFALPNQIRDSAPYTLEAWVLNPEAKQNECIIDLSSSEEELQKVMLCSGKEPRCGVVCHFGWFEDMGFPELVGTGKWQYWAITYDGYMEKVYLNGKKIKEKDILLLLTESKYITLGRTACGDWPFSGFLHGIKLYEGVLNDEEILEHYIGKIELKTKY
ncbi:MAG: family 43 glycosylhydrolase [Bacteroidales bacterium]